VPHPKLTRGKINKANLQRVYGSLPRVRNPPTKFKRSTAKERAEKKLNEGIRRVYHDDDSESGEGRFRGGADDEDKAKKAMARLLDASADLDEGDELEAHGPATGLHGLLAVATKPGASKVKVKHEFAPSAKAVAKPTSSGMPLLLSGSQSLYNGYARKMLSGEHISKPGVAKQTVKEISVAINYLKEHNGLSEDGAKAELLKRLKMKQGGGIVGAGIWDEIKKAFGFLTNPFGTVSKAVVGSLGKSQLTPADKQGIKGNVQKEMNAEYEKMNSNEEGEGRRKRKGGVKSLRAKLAEPPKTGGDYGVGDAIMTGLTTPFKMLGSLFGLGSRADLPTTREGYCELAKKMSGKGHPIRVNSGSQLKSIRANFIKKLGL
jgi:hypothetical protein